MGGEVKIKDLDCGKLPTYFPSRHNVSSAPVWLSVMLYSPYGMARLDCRRCPLRHYELDAFFSQKGDGPSLAVHNAHRSSAPSKPAMGSEMARRQTLARRGNKSRPVCR